MLYQRPPRPEEVRVAPEFVPLPSPTSPNWRIARQNGTGKGRPDGQRRRDRMAANKTPAKPNPGNRNNARRAIQNEGEMVDRKPLTPWEDTRRRCCSRTRSRT